MNPTYFKKKEIICKLSDGLKLPRVTSELHLKEGRSPLKEKNTTKDRICMIKKGKANGLGMVEKKWHYRDLESKVL